jgi:UDP:flavonoid glycosyltransferase YjiC (YdhE family)
LGTFLMVIHGSDGDLLPVLRIGRTLRARGHDVTVLTHARYSNRVRRAGLAFIPVDIMNGETRRGDPDLLRVVAGEPADTPQHFSAMSGFIPQLRFECRALVRRHRPGRTVLVSSCTLNMSALTVGEALGAPVACLAMAPYYLLALPDQVPALHDTLTDDVARSRADLGLAPVTDWSEWVFSADAYLGLWPQWFDRAGPAAQVRPTLTGFVLPDEGEADDFPAEAAALLAGPTRPVLLTGGTSQMLHRGFYPATLAACAGLDRPVLLVTAQQDLPDGPLPPNMHWFPRLPFASVIPRVAAVLHHGGLSTSARAAAAGVPQVVLGYGFDRADNGARLAAAGAGAFLPPDGWTPDRVRRLLDDALRGPRPVPQPAGPVADPAALAADELERLGTRTLPDFAAPAAPAAT